MLVPSPIRGFPGLWLSVLAAVSCIAPGARAQGQAQVALPTQPLAAALAMDKGATCLDSEELVEQISGWLGTDRVPVQLVIEVQGSPYFARTVWFRIRRTGELLAQRRFDPAPARCEALHAAVGLAIALALKASPLDSATPAGSASGAATGDTLGLSGQALGGVAVVPGANFGIGLGLRYPIATRLEVRLSALALVGPDGGFQGDRGRFGSWLALGRLDGCIPFAPLRSVGLAACVGVAAGGLSATGEAFPMSRQGLTGYVAVAGALELDLELGSNWSLATGVHLFVPLRATRFVVRDQAGAVTAARDLAPVSALIAVGPAYRF